MTDNERKKIVVAEIKNMAAKFPKVMSPALVSHFEDVLNHANMTVYDFYVYLDPTEYPENFRSVINDLKDFAHSLVFLKTTDSRKIVIKSTLMTEIGDVYDKNDNMRAATDYIIDILNVCTDITDFWRWCVRYNNRTCIGPYFAWEWSPYITRGRDTLVKAAIGQLSLTDRLLLSNVPEIDPEQLVSRMISKHEQALLEPNLLSVTAASIIGKRIMDAIIDTCIPFTH